MPLLSKIRYNREYRHLSQCRTICYMHSRATMGKMRIAERTDDEGMGARQSGRRLDII